MLGLMPEPVRQQGYSLLELMVTLGIVAILAAVAVPSFSDFVRTQRLRSVSNDLASTFQFARSEAVKRNVSVAVVRTGASWSEGWNVVSAANTLRSSDGASGVVITGSSTTYTFLSNGRTSASGTLSLSVANASNAKCVRLSLNGSVRTDDGGC